MATRGTVLDCSTQRLILRLRLQGWSVRRVARALHVSHMTVLKYGRTDTALPVLVFRRAA